MSYPTVTAGTTITSVWGNGVRDSLINVFASNSARDSSITSPQVGMVEYIKSNDIAEGLTSRNSAGVWRKPWNVPWGQTSLIVLNSNQTGIGTSPTDLTGLSFTSVPYIGNRLWRISVYLMVQQITGSGVPQLTICDGSNVIQQTINWQGGAAAAEVGALTGFVTWSAASSTTVTFKLRLSTTANTVNTVASTAVPVTFMIEDIGPVGPPT